MSRSLPWTRLKRILPQTLGKRLKRVEAIQPGPAFHCRRYRSARFRDSARRCRSYRVHVPFDGAKMAIVTDLGYMPELVKVHLRGADCLVLESNHDLDMLKVGPYPWVVKAARAEPHRASLKFMLSANIFPTPMVSTRWRANLVPAHVSQENNNPDLVRLSAEEALEAPP